MSFSFFERLVTDPADSGRSFVFNGDNKQVQVRDAQNNVVGEYVYDGNAKRVKKITGTEYIVFVYDGFGKLIGEYSTAGPPAEPMVHYTATDPLGSPRVLTNERGDIVSRRDFMPFGEEIAPDATYRTAAHKYGVGDNVRQKFTGYERDDETGLDFAEARYYYNNHGRFTAVDPLLASGKSANPQTFNRYAYTMNRPLIFTDPTGLQTATNPNEKPKVVQPLIKVTIDLPPANAYINDKQRNGEYFTGVASIATIRITGTDGKALSGASVSETNTCVSGNCGNLQQYDGKVTTDNKGEFPDIVGKGGVTTVKQNDVPEDDLIGFKEQANNTEIHSVSEQTLTIETPNGGVYQAVAQRTVTNMSDGKVSEEMNKNGVNLKVSSTEYKVTVVKPPPALFLRPLRTND